MLDGGLWVVCGIWSNFVGRCVVTEKGWINQLAQQKVFTDTDITGSQGADLKNKFLFWSFASFSVDEIVSWLIKLMKSFLILNCKHLRFWLVPSPSVEKQNLIITMKFFKTVMVIFTLKSVTQLTFTPLELVDVPYWPSYPISFLRLFLGVFPTRENIIIDDYNERTLGTKLSFTLSRFFEPRFFEPCCSPFIRL